MHARRLPRDVKDGLVHLRLGRGVLVILTVEEFVCALQRGKMERRRQRRADHQQCLQARHEAQALAWLDDEGGV